LGSPERQASPLGAPLEREESAVLAAVSGVHQALTNAARLIVPLADKLRETEEAAARGRCVAPTRPGTAGAVEARARHVRVPADVPTAARPARVLKDPRAGALVERHALSGMSRDQPLEAVLVPRGMAAEPPVAGRSVGRRGAPALIESPQDLQTIST